MSKETVQSLREQMADIQTKIRRAEAVDTFAAATKLIGKCFKYRNCYSCPQKESDYWWMYSRVTGCDKHGDLIVFQFQTDKDGKVEIEQAARGSARMMGADTGGYRPITLKQFQHAWKTLAKRLNADARAAKAVKP